MIKDKIVKVVYTEYLEGETTAIASIDDSLKMKLLAIFLAYFGDPLGVLVSLMLLIFPCVGLAHCGLGEVALWLIGFFAGCHLGSFLVVRDLEEITLEEYERRKENVNNRKSD